MKRAMRVRVPQRDAECGRGSRDARVGMPVSPHRWRLRPASIGDQAKPDLAPAGQLDIDLGEQLRVEQGAMLDAVAAVDPEAHAQGIEAVLGAGMAGPREGQRVDASGVMQTGGRPQRSSS